MTNPRSPVPTLRSFTSRSSGELTPASGISSLALPDREHIFYTARLFVDVYFKSQKDEVDFTSTAVRSSLDQAMEKTLEDLVLAWLDSRGFPPRNPGGRFLSLKDVLLESIAITCQSSSTEVDVKAQSYKDKVEYRNLAHTLRVTPTGAVRSATQERLIQILEKLGGNC
jgi:hypothetical protein